jgi:formylglycine-generating enzyme required for sulfatase activity
MKIVVQILAATVLLAVSNLWAQPPVVSNISYVQRVDANGSLTKMVDIQYDLDGNRSMFVEFFFSADGGQTFPVACVSMLGDAGPNIQAGPLKNAAWDAAVDWNENFTERGRIMIKATYGDQPTGFPGLDQNGSGPPPDHNGSVSVGIETVAIPFPATGGITYGPSESVRYYYQTAIDAGDLTTFPVRFHVDKNEVTFEKWNEVVLWGRDNGYSDLVELYPPQGGEGIHSAELAFGDFQNVVKWLNARSEMEGLEPVFYLELREPGSDVNGDGQISNGPDALYPTAEDYADPTFQDPYQDLNFNPDPNGNYKWDPGEYFVDRNNDGQFDPREFDDWDGDGIRAPGLITVYRVGTIERTPPVNPVTGYPDFNWNLISHAKLSANGYRLPSTTPIYSGLGLAEVHYLAMGGRAEQGSFDEFSNQTVYLDEWPWGGTEASPSDQYAVVPPNGHIENPGFVVGTKPPNGFGLFDMVGNVAELSLEAGMSTMLFMNSYGGSGSAVPTDPMNPMNPGMENLYGPALWLGQSDLTPIGFRSLRLEF